MSVQDRDLGFKKILNNLPKLHKKVKVGVQGSDATEAKENSDGETIEGLTVVDVATFHEFGTENVPQRSFLGDTIDKNKGRYFAIMEKMKTQVLTGQMDVDKALSIIGLEIASNAKERIKAGIAPKLDDQTIAKKGSSTPLIDSGQLRQSITFVVEGGEK
jgi:phage gpG-like protein